LILFYNILKHNFQKEYWYETTKDLKSNGPFEWKGGRSKCTKGILLLNKPIPIEVPKYGKVSIADVQQ